MATAAPTAEVKGARLTFTVSALVEGIYFGLLPLLIPSTLYTWFAPNLSPATTELGWLQMAGAMALALGIGCWMARTGDRAVVRLMSLLMLMAKGLGTVLFVWWLLAGTVPQIMWINAAVTAILAVWNGWQYWVASR